MPNLIDLTLTLGGDRITEVPGLLGVETEPLMTHQSHARSNTRLTLPTHIGTHVDAPYHFHPDGTTLEEMPLEKYMGLALLLDLRESARSNTPISVDDLHRAGGETQALRDKIVVLFTAWAERESGNARFYSEGPLSKHRGSRLSCPLRR